MLTFITWFFFISFIITTLSFYFTFQKKNKFFVVENYEKELENYEISKINKKILNIQQKLEEDINIDRIEFNDLVESRANLEKITLNELRSLYKNVYAHIDGVYLFRFHKFSTLINRIYEKQFEYKVNYLEIIFKINELNLKNDLKKSLSYNIRECYKFLNNRIIDSKYEQWVTRSSIIKRIYAMDDLIEEITLLSNKADVPFVSFVKKIKKILYELNSIEVDVKFLEETYETINTLLKNINDKFKQITSKNRSAFSKQTKEWKEAFKKFNNKIIEIKKAALLLEKNFVRRELNEIIIVFLEITRDAFINRESYIFILNYDKKLEYIYNNYQNDEKTLVYELEKFQISDKNKKINAFKKINELIQSDFEEYFKKRSKGFSEFSPFEIINNDIKKIQTHLNKYFFILENVYLEIKVIINKTDDINKKLYTMNLELLKSEGKMDSILPISRFKYEKQFEFFQQKISDLIYEYKNDIRIPTKDKMDDINSLYEEIIIFSNKIHSEAFKFIYTQKMIVALNKYYSLNKVSNLIDDLRMKYQEGNIVDSLRIGKKIIEIGNIYE